MPLPLPVRRRISLLPALAGCLLAVVLLHAGLQRIARLRVGEAPAPLPPAGGVADPGGAAAWWEGGVGLLAQTTEPQFYGSALAGLGMIAGAWLAHAAARGRRRWRGFDVSYATGLWPWVLLAAALALALSNLAWGWTRAGGAWQPTFVPFASAAPAIVLIYGPGWRTALTGAVLGAGITTPLALLLVAGVADPLGLPAVTGSVAAMALGALAAFALCRALPWMARPAPLPPRHDVQVEANAIAEAHAASAGHPGTGSHAIPEPDAVAEVRSIAESKAVTADRAVAEAAGVPRGGRRVGRAARGRWWSRGFGMRDALWLPRRALADLTEPQFYGNEWSSLGLVAGVLLAWWWTLPEATAAATLVPDVLAAQLLTACLAAWLYAGQWSEEGWYPTFVPLVSLVPAAVLDAGGGWPAMLAAAALGAALGPGLARLIARRLPADFHPFIGSVAAMCLLTATGVPVLRAVL